MTAGACDACLARSWLLDRLTGHIERARGRLGAVLGLGNDELIAALGGTEREAVLAELRRFDPGVVRSRAVSRGLECLCRCDPGYPASLTALPHPPAVLHIAGGRERFLDLVSTRPVGIVGARRASAYGLEVARSLGRGLAAAGVTVLSGLALGIDSAAHAGALSGGAACVAVLPGSAVDPYPASRRALHRQILVSGAAVSELGPGSAVRRWTFLARNRIIAALAAMTVVVEAGERSGSLTTAGLARECERLVGAVPGQVTSPLAAGPNDLLATGAVIVRGPQDVLDAVYGVGARAAPRPLDPGELPAELRPVLAAIARGQDTAGALARAGYEPEQALAALASLELAGVIRRGPGGRFQILP